MKKALIENATGKVINIVKVDVPDWDPGTDYSLADIGPGAKPGAIYSGGSYSKSPEQIAEEAAKEAEAIVALRQTVIDFANELSAGFTAQYPTAEMQSWPAKQAEAALIAAGETDPAKFPVIANEAALSGQTPAEIVAKVSTKANQFAPIAGLISAFRQNAHTKIDAAASLAEADAAFEAEKAALLAAIAAL